MFDLGDIVTLVSFLVIKPTLILLLTFWLVRQFARDSAAAQFYCLSLGLVALLGLPLGTLLLPAIEIAVLPSLPGWSPATPWSGGVVVVTAVLAVYLLGLFWVLFYVAGGVFMVNRQYRRCLPCRDRHTLAQVEEIRVALAITRPLAVVVAPALHTPQVWGWWRPVLMIPPALCIWSTERRRRVLIHELAHIKRNDWLVLMTTRLVCALFWFIPLTWIAARRLQTMAEVACDDQVVAMAGRRLDYAEDLVSMVKQARRQAHSDVVLAAAAPSQLADRIRALLDGARDRSHFSVANRTWLCLLGLATLLPLSSLQATVLPEAVNRARSYLVQPLVPVDLPPVTASRDRAASVDGDDLAILKAQLVDRRQPPAAMEQLVVFAELPPALPQDWVEGIDVALPGTTLRQAEVQIRGYMPLVTVTPVYPQRARRRGIEGQVIVQFTISPQGRVAQPRIVVSQPARVFDRAVLKALQGFRFRPYYSEGEPLAISGVTETFTFRLSEPEPAGQHRRRPAFSGPTQIVRADSG